MNIPPALLLMSTRVSTFSFLFFPLICIGIDKELDSILAVLTLMMSRQGETDIETVLLFKNPALLILSKICLLHCSCLLSSFKCGDEVPFCYTSLASGFVAFEVVLMCWPGWCQDNLFQDVLVFCNQSTILSACILHVVQASLNWYPLC